jgi:ABC-2 type transport system permease protein
MTAIAAPATVHTAPGNSPLVAFFAILRRDVAVTGRELPAFLAQVILQPLGLLFVFGRVLTELGFTNPAYAKQLFPGIVAMTLMLTAIQSVAFPLVIDFSFTKEIEDRLLAPLPATWVAAEKIVFAASRAIVAALVMFPVGVLVLGSIPFSVSGLPLLIASIILGSLAGGAMGLTLGTAVSVNRINIMFAIVLTPLIFTGCSQYPWPSLSKLPWFQVLTLFNPLTYVSEGTRAALVPNGVHMLTWIPPLALLLATAIFGYLGMRGFRRRAID